MKNFKIFLLVLSGFLLHKFIYEISEMSNIIDYKICIKNSNKTSELSPYQQCREKLEYNKISKILLYTPNFWEKWDN